MKKQVILTINNDAFYTAKLVLSALLNRVDIEELNKPTIEVLINTDKILEKRLSIPSLRYTNEQLDIGASVFISFPFQDKLLIQGDNVFIINKNTKFVDIMEDLCNYLDLKVDLSTNSIIKTMILTLEYLDDLVIRIKGEDLSIEGMEFFTLADLVNFTILSTMPTLELSKIFRYKDSEVIVRKIDELESLNNTEELFEGLEWNSLGYELVLFKDISLPEDVELNSAIFKKISNINNSRDINILTTTHLINLLSQQVITGEVPVYKIPEIENPKFSI